MTGELIAVLLLAMPGCSRLPRLLTKSRSDVVVVCGECGNDGGWTRFLGDFKGLAP